MHPEPPVQHEVARGLVQNCQFDKPYDNLAQCSYWGKPHSEKVHLNSPLQVNLHSKPKVWLRSQHNTAVG